MRLYWLELGEPVQVGGDLTACVGTPRSSRLAIPASVPAGGNSTIAVTLW